MAPKPQRLKNYESRVVNSFEIKFYPVMSSKSQLHNFLIFVEKGICDLAGSTPIPLTVSFARIPSSNVGSTGNIIGAENHALWDCICKASHLRVTSWNFHLPTTAASVLAFCEVLFCVFGFFKQFKCEIRTWPVSPQLSQWWPSLASLSFLSFLLFLLLKWRIYLFFIHCFRPHHHSGLIRKRFGVILLELRDTTPHLPVVVSHSGNFHTHQRAPIAMPQLVRIVFFLEEDTRICYHPICRPQYVQILGRKIAGIQLTVIQLLPYSAPCSQ